MGALGRPTFRSWGLINVENLVCQKKKIALGVLRIGLDGMVRMGKATVGLGVHLERVATIISDLRFLSPFCLSS